MEGPDNVREEIEAVLRRLRWSLTGLRMGGIRDFPGRADVGGRVAECEIIQTPKSEIRLPSSELRPATSVHQALLEIQREMGDCRKCRLHSGRTHLVFGDGLPEAGLVFVGEGPGFDEDKQGRPFVGRAGKLLDKMIMAIGFHREQVYICNVVKCRPPNNRTPNPDEIEACSPFLVKQLTALQPRAIFALGACAAQTLLGTDSYISRLRGKVHRWRGIPLICSFHPAYLLRNPAQKAATWQDLMEVYRLLHADSGKAHSAKALS